ncbi:MAG: hypothetical protein LC804_14085 [Acidobacteria bacterium]|nr:hypothetical protein [Acidobacteriota bacterium]
MKHITSRRTLGWACLLMFLAAPSAHAVVVRAGGSLIAIAAATRGSAVAYDSTNRVYLVVSTRGVLRGRFVQADGTPVGTAFVIQTSGNYTHFPRVAFSPEAADATGGFLVTWHESDLPQGATSVHGRMVSVSANGAYGPDTNLAADGSFWEVGAAVAYGSGSREFLVAWRKLAGNDIRAVRVGLGGTPKGAVFNVTATPTQYEDNPSVAYNASRNEFLVVYAGFNDPGNYAFVDSQRVQAGADGMMGSVVRLIQTAGTYITDVSHNSQTGRYLAAWYSTPAEAAFGRVVEGDGSLGGGILTLSTRWKAYDALSVAFNTRSNSFYMVSHSSGAEDGGVELDLNGTPIDNGMIVTGAGGTGNFYPRIAASADQPEWLLSTANSFTSTMVQRLAGSGGGGAPPPPPPTATSNPRMSLDVPRTGSTTAGNFTVAGWAADLASTTDGGVGAVHVWAYPNPGSGAAAMFLGAAAMGISRPDVGAAFGARFSSTGFVLNGALAPGTYDVVAFAHSSVAGVFNNSQTARIQVLAPPSIPRMVIDLPAQNQSVSQNVLIAGWALDVGAVIGTGVDAVHVWAYPIAGGDAIFVGVATLGHLRPDVAAAFGEARFGGGGYRLEATLPRGEYNLVVFAHSVNTNSFNNAALVRIRVL